MRSTGDAIRRMAPIILPCLPGDGGAVVLRRVLLSMLAVVMLCGVRASSADAFWPGSAKHPRVVGTISFSESGRGSGYTSSVDAGGGVSDPLQEGPFTNNRPTWYALLYDRFAISGSQTFSTDSSSCTITDSSENSTTSFAFHYVPATKTQAGYYSIGVDFEPFSGAGTDCGGGYADYNWEFPTRSAGAGLPSTFSGSATMSYDCGSGCSSGDTGTLKWNLRLVDSGAPPRCEANLVLPPGVPLPAGCKPLPPPENTPGGKQSAVDKEVMLAKDGVDVVLSCGDAADESGFADDVTAPVPVLGEAVEVVGALHDISDCITAQKEMMEEALGDPPDRAYARLYLPSVTQTSVKPLVTQCRKLSKSKQKLCLEMAAEVGRFSAAEARREAALRAATVAHNRYTSAQDASDTAAESLQAAAIRLFYGEIGSAVSARNSAAKDLAMLLTEHHVNEAPSQDALSSEKARLLSGRDGASTAISQITALGYSDTQAQQALATSLDKASTSSVSLTSVLQQRLPGESFTQLFDGMPVSAVASIAGSFRLSKAVRAALTHDLGTVQAACSARARVRAGGALLRYIRTHLRGSARTYASEAAKPLSSYQSHVSAPLASCH